MCQSTLTAYADMVDFGLLSSAAVMVPCPWFPATAAFVRNHPQRDQLDIGVHLTLTSEWDAFRWGPISSRDAATGMLDSEGYFHRDARGFQEHCQATAVQQEIVAQVERAISAGIEPTHIDNHMLSILHPTLLPLYFQLGQHYRLPNLMFRTDAAGFERMGVPAEQAAVYAQMLRQLEEQGQPLFDHIHMMPLDDGSERLAKAQAALDNLPPGLTYFIIHPTTDTPEIRALAPDWRARVADYRLFTDERWRQAVADSGVQVVGYRAIREAMRAQ
jgi:predicted glycoside hydrolase/deacetylase ChbG (UPF0249 family)